MSVSYCSGTLQWTVEEPQWTTTPSLWLDPTCRNWPVMGPQPPSLLCTMKCTLWTLGPTTVLVVALTVLQPTSLKVNISFSSQVYVLDCSWSAVAYTFISVLECVTIIMCCHKTSKLLYVPLSQLAVEGPVLQKMVPLCSLKVPKWVQRSPISAVLALYQELFNYLSVHRIDPGVQILHN